MCERICRVKTLSQSKSWRRQHWLSLHKQFKTKEGAETYREELKAKNPKRIYKISVQICR